MRRIVVVLAAAGIAAVTLVTVGGAAGTAPVVVRGTVGPGYTIQLTQNGKRVTTLKAGSYRFVVSDRSSRHNFVLERARGGAFEKAITSVSFVGTKTFTVTLGKGTWEFYCHPHQSTMKGKFVVAGGTAGAAAPTPTPEPGDDNGGGSSGGSTDSGYPGGAGGVDY